MFARLPRSITGEDVELHDFLYQVFSAAREISTNTVLI
jgi:hypothetical protein